ncbi:hypothetical protein RhiLY_07722 [Ceratobasidium sp. AG-Ba]|nr:hypothetical protein RhiLY_07722 [Ceratobasidium sp. AG-Ba]
MVKLTDDNKTFLRTYAHRYGKVVPGPCCRARRKAIWGKACSAIVNRFLELGRMGQTVRDENRIEELCLAVYRFIDNNRDKDRTHRYHRNFKVHPNVTPRITRSKAILNENENAEANGLMRVVEDGEDDEIDVVGVSDDEGEGERDCGRNCTDKNNNPADKRLGEIGAATPPCTKKHSVIHQGKLEVVLPVSKSTFERMRRIQTMPPPGGQGDLNAIMPIERTEVMPQNGRSRKQKTANDKPAAARAPRTSKAGDGTTTRKPSMTTNMSKKAQQTNLEGIEPQTAAKAPQARTRSDTVSSRGVLD